MRSPVVPHHPPAVPQNRSKWQRASDWVISRPFALLLPMLVVYVAIVLIASKDTFQGDEGRYVGFATNLSNGYYSPPGGVDLWWGPGYPIVLLPFIVLQLPWLAAKLLNALLLFGAIVYFYKTLALYISSKKAALFSVLLGMYPPLMRETHLLMTEPLVTFLLSSFAYNFCKLHQDGKVSKFRLVVASGLMAYLALTKVFFGYVIPTVAVVLAGWHLFKPTIHARKSLLVFVFALVMCLPYLTYTYSLTGKLFYWGTSGGMSLYWMSTPYPGELGDWFSWEMVQEVPQMQMNHQSFFDSISGLDQVARDDEFKAQAMYNITHHPGKFVQNWAANIGRLLFSYPYSYTPQKLSTYFFLLPNMVVIVMAMLCIYPSYRGRRLIPREIAHLLLLVLVTLAGSSLLSAYERQFHVLVPIVALWLAFTLDRVVRVKIRSG